MGLPMPDMPLTVSIHAPARGATDHRLARRVQQRFQSTLPRGERHLTNDLESQLNAVSIHAPARGATTCPSGTCRPSRSFNPRSREGSDRLMSLASLIAICFNPRSREGSDAIALEVGRRERVSIHAPARGATSSRRP